MRPLLLSLPLVLLGLGLVLAQTSDAGNGGGGTATSLPVGQTFKQFEFPIWQNGKLKATFDAVEAKGITLNRAETTDLRINVYDNGIVTTTITSPNADLYVNEQIMRTSHTVKIVRTDMDLWSQDCNFDLINKKFLLRTKVKVLLKHFDISFSPTTNASPGAPLPPPKPVAPEAGLKAADSGTSAPASDTNAAPEVPASPETK